MSQELIIYKENKPKVLHDLKDGRIDYVDLTHWDFMDRFFAFLLGKDFFRWSQDTYPNPRKKNDIPIWFLLACAVQMKLHTETAFDNLPGILQSGSILTRVKFNVGLKGGGFNYKNKKPRQTAIDQDTLRKYYKDTDPFQLMGWYNHDVVGWLRHFRGFDKSGVAILDSSYLFLPDNPNYQGTSLLPFDENDNIIDPDKLQPQERSKVKYKRCYKLTSLLHTSPTTDYYIYAGCHLGPGNESGLTIGEKLVDNFVQRFGKKVLKLIIADREFTDGAMITKFKKEYHIDTILPLKSNSSALKDALGILTSMDTKWQLYSQKADREGNVIEKEEVAGVAEITSWDECKVPLYVAVMNRTDKEGKQETWALACTKALESASLAFDLYKMRTKIEERHRQLKSCWRLSEFTSTDLSLVTFHVVSSLLVYSLVQFYLNCKGMRQLANNFISTLRQREQLGKDAAIVYSGRYFATFDMDEYTDIIITLEGDPRTRLSRWIKEFRKHKIRAP